MRLNLKAPFSHSIDSLIANDFVLILRMSRSPHHKIMTGKSKGKKTAILSCVFLTC